MIIRSRMLRSVAHFSAAACSVRAGRRVSRVIGRGSVAALDDEIRAEDRVAELEATCRRLQRQLGSAKAKTDELVDAVERAAKDAAVIVGQAKPVKAPKRNTRNHAHSALLHLTDWQLGKATESYDPLVCRVRVEKAIQKTLRLADIQRAAYPVGECVVMLGGDMIEGVGIFPGQAFEVDSTAFEQVFDAASIIESSLLTLLEHFPSVRVYEAAGNHGRIGRKGENPRKDNWDRVLYRIVRDRLHAQDRLVWHEPTGWYEIAEIGKYRALLVHGDQIKSFGGNVPAFGISRKAIAWSSGVTEPFDDMYMGHFHQVMQLTMANGGRVFVTPSTESGSEYAREFVGARGRPGQRLHFVDPEAGRVTAEYVIWLD